MFGMYFVNYVKYTFLFDLLYISFWYYYLFGGDELTGRGGDGNSYIKFKLSMNQ